MAWLLKGGVIFECWTPETLVNSCIYHSRSAD